MAHDLRLSVAELRQRMLRGEQFTILDARNPNAWAESPEMARGAIRVPADAPEGELRKVPREKPVLTYCT